ncbi:B12-binding domain-containing radical SAM protein [Labilibacter marinus]|uniref:B12-binding domain-containing radical SAM protein n=1 Tax=Labilibacter marinus TaxID=1477105 RepID=UPI000837A04F|nr:radical SAM protein [Labilibacter marinus]
MILLNCLPPADIKTPSISLSILKKFMSQNGVEAEVKYWNFLLSPMLEFDDSEDTEVRLLLFLSILNDRNKSEKGNKRILSFLQKLQPEYKTHGSHYYAEFLESAKAEILQTMEEELQKFDFSDIKIFGITAKYNQWIPGMLLAEYVKELAPHVKVLVGGFCNGNVAQEAMKVCPHFDMATWGEGEYPLLKLHEELKNDQPDLSSVPRFMFREGGEIIKSNTNKSDYLDFQHYPFPDYSDYINSFPNPDEMDEVSIPINTMRSCSWGKCKFCDFNQGYRLRMRTPESVVEEIAHINQQYGLRTFSFVDSDTFGNLDHFNRLLDLIIELKLSTSEDLEFWSEIIPNTELTSEMIERMAIAGFKNIFIGYDGLSDSMLAKMNKRNNFSNNLFFVKESLKNGIYPYVNVIKHIVDETEDDVQECISNLHYTRFFYNDAVVSFLHNYVNLVLSSMSKYYRLIDEKERKHYDYDVMTYLLPDFFTEDENRFHLFRYEKNIPTNNKEWDKLLEIEDYYKENCFTYKVQEHAGVVYYTEYCNNEEIENIVFEEPEYGAVLKAAQHKVLTFEELQHKETITALNMNSDRLKEIMSHLKQAHILYYNQEFSNVVSLINLS